MRLETDFQRNMVTALWNGIRQSSIIEDFLRQHPEKDNEKNRTFLGMLRGGAAGAYNELTRPLGTKPTDEMKEEVSEIVKKAKILIIPPGFQPWNDLEDIEKETIPTF